MCIPDLLQHLYAWIEALHLPLEAIPNLHCFRLFRSVPLPDGGTVSAVSIRHQAPRAARAPDLFVAELWTLRQGPIRPADAKDMCLALATFRAWYAEILEEAEVEGLRRRHRFSVHGNLIGASVEPAAAVDLLSYHGGEVAFWTYLVGVDSVRFEPHYGEGQPNSRSVLVPMLNHLSWEALRDQDTGSGGMNSDILPTLN
jgi:hypothetical protein